MVRLLVGQYCIVCSTKLFNASINGSGEYSSTLVVPARASGRPAPWCAVVCYCSALRSLVANQPCSAALFRLEYHFTLVTHSTSIPAGQPEWKFGAQVHFNGQPVES